jgi:hypothetical protein
MMKSAGNLQFFLQSFTEILLRQCTGHHAKWGISPSRLEIFEELQTFLNLQATSRQWTQLFGSSITCIVLRLADIDLRNVGAWGWISNDPRSYLASSFAQNLELLQKSMVLGLPINPQILRTPLKDLNTGDLKILCDVLLESILVLDYKRMTSETPAM